MSPNLANVPEQLMLTAISDGPHRRFRPVRTVFDRLLELVTDIDY